MCSHFIYLVMFYFRFEICPIIFHTGGEHGGSWSLRCPHRLLHCSAKDQEVVPCPILPLHWYRCGECVHHSSADSCSTEPKTQNTKRVPWSPGSGACGLEWPCYFCPPCSFCCSSNYKEDPRAMHATGPNTSLKSVMIRGGDAVCATKNT